MRAKVSAQNRGTGRRSGITASVRSSRLRSAVACGSAASSSLSTRRPSGHHPGVGRTGCRRVPGARRTEGRTAHARSAGRARSRAPWHLGPTICPAALPRSRWPGCSDAGLAGLPIHMGWCMGVTLLNFTPSRVAKGRSRSETRNPLNGYNGEQQERRPGFGRVPCGRVRTDENADGNHPLVPGLLLNVTVLTAVAAVGLPAQRAIWWRAARRGAAAPTRPAENRRSMT
jgi:hypothetical protein